MPYMPTDLPPAELFRLAQAIAQVDPAKSPSASCRAASARRRRQHRPALHRPGPRLGDRARDDATLESCD